MTTDMTICVVKSHEYRVLNSIMFCERNIKVAIAVAVPIRKAAAHHPTMGIMRLAVSTRSR
jgi:hypothetical protein